MFKERIEHIHCQKCGAGEEHIRYLVREYTERRITIEEGAVCVGKPSLIGDTKGKDKLFGCAKCKHTWPVPGWVTVA